MDFQIVRIVPVVIRNVVIINSYPIFLFVCMSSVQISVQMVKNTGSTTVLIIVMAPVLQKKQLPVRSALRRNPVIERGRAAKLWYVNKPLILPMRAASISKTARMPQA